MTNATRRRAGNALEVRRRRRNFRYLAFRREHHPPPHPPAAQLDEHEPNGDGNEIRSQRRRVPQIRRAAEERDEHFLQEILDGGVRAEVAPQYAPDDV